MSLYSIDTHGELRPFLNYEWLLTNGAGAFASSTIVGCNTRRYHGLLCAATKPPVGRMMTLNRIGELLFLDGRSDEFHELSVNQFRHSFHPRGDRLLRRFELDGVARWEYHIESIRVVKELQLAWQRNLVGIRYSVLPEAPDRAIELHLLPFISMRDFHALRHSRDTTFDVSVDGWQLSATLGLHTLDVVADAGHFVRHGDWWFGHTYAIETDRGMDDTEDLFVPGELIHKSVGPFTLTLWASLGESGPFDWDKVLAARPTSHKSEVRDQKSEVRDQKSEVGSQNLTSDLRPLTSVLNPLPEPEAQTPSLTIQRLHRAAADFVVSRKRPDDKPAATIIAGYPWFADWGRDTMISLPGLLLTTGRYAEACQVLCLFAEYVSDGMIPNRFDDYNNQPHYNTVDASLWFIHACFEYLRCSKDSATFDSVLLPACRAIVAGYRHGTRYKIAMDGADGLITAGDEHTQLTWMDAKFNNVCFTPRHGKAVEINALWYNALVLLDEKDLAAKVQESFVKAFWMNPFRGLYDCIHGSQRDAALRPNQIFAVSLPHSPLSQEQQHAVVESVRRELLTPYGLRTLAKSDPNYKGRFQGGPMQRDAAYHNGTVWPWLIGPFLEAYLRVHNSTPNICRQGRVWLQPLIDHMNQGCIGQISECFEGDEPHRPVACPAQAWSVAEVLRLATMLGM